MVKRYPKTKKNTFSNIKSAFFIAIVGAGILAASFLVQRETFKVSQAAEEVPPTLVQNVGGTAKKETTVSTANAIQAQGATLFVASISMKPQREIAAVNGLGLQWQKVVGQCGGRGQTGVEMWTAVGTPSGDGQVSATFKSAPLNSVISVSTFTNVDPAKPVETSTAFNTSGQNGSCSKGKDSEVYSGQVTTTGNSLILSAVATRLRAHTPTSGFTEVMDIQFGSDNGDKAGLAIQTKQSTTAETVTIAGTLSSDTDWATTALVIKGNGGGKKPRTSPSPSPISTPTAQPSSSPTTQPTTSPTTAPSTPPTSGTPGSGIWISKDEIRRQQTSGAQWTVVYNAAAANWGTPNIADQNSNHDNSVMAGAIVCVRTGEFCDKTEKAIVSAIGTEGNTRWLAVGRNLLGYVIAADLMDLRANSDSSSNGSRVQTWLASFLTRELPDNNTGVPEKLTAFESGSNASAQEASVYAALAAYTNDKNRLEYVWNRFRLYSCDKVNNPETVIDLKAGTDYNWDADNFPPCGVSPLTAEKTVPKDLPGAGSTHTHSGAIMNDMRRGGTYQWPPGYTSYPWVGLEGYVPTALILARQGYQSFEVSHQAVKRAYDYLWYVKVQTRNEDWFDGVRGDETTHIVNKYYGTSYPTQSAIGAGRTFGFTGFTHQTQESLFK